MSRAPETVVINVRSITNALRDFATLHERGILPVEFLTGLADRIEEMAATQEEGGDQNEVGPSSR